MTSSQRFAPEKQDSSLDNINGADVEEIKVEQQELIEKKSNNHYASGQLIQESASYGTNSKKKNNIRDNVVLFKTSTNFAPGDKN